MKLLLKNKFFILLIALTIVSCESFLKDDINVDPNKPINVPVNGLLPAVEINIADVTGGAFSRFNCMITQQVEGVARQWTSFNNYSGLTPNRFDAAWQNFYENILLEIENIIKQSDEKGYNHYKAIAQTLKAYSLMMMTDVWGDIPYTEALSGDGNRNPKFDDQETVIYPEIYKLLNDAEANFALDNGGLAPSVDLIYGGEISKWLKAINAIRARALLHQGNYTDALSNIQNSFESRDDNLRFTYTASDQGPWYRFNDGRTGDIEFHPFMSSLMDDLNDTARKEIFSKVFRTSHPYLVADFGQDLISYREAKFIEAECINRLNGSNTDMNNAYLAGIRASFEEVGLEESDYDSYVANSVVNPGAGSLTLNHILTQKYIGLFVQPEVFNDYRRTGFPNISPTSGSVVPVRWNYSGDEMLFNSNAPSPTEATLFTPKVDWNN